MFRTDGPTLPPNDPIWQSTREVCAKCGKDYCICQLDPYQPKEVELLRKLQKILAHQLNPNMHPLTCGNNSKHNVLIPILVYDQIELHCRDCDWVQKWNPLEEG